MIFKQIAISIEVRKRFKKANVGGGLYSNQYKEKRQF